MFTIFALWLKLAPLIKNDCIYYLCQRLEDTNNDAYLSYINLTITSATAKGMTA